MKHQRFVRAQACEADAARCAAYRSPSHGERLACRDDEEVTAQKARDGLSVAWLVPYVTQRKVKEDN